jgi:putative hydrolase
MIKNDLHIHSVQSACGMHTFLEIVHIAVRKGMRMINICDHGPASGRRIAFSVLADKKRIPDPVVLSDGSSISVLRGIEANIIDKEGLLDTLEDLVPRFDLISAGFHYYGKLPLNGSETDNTETLVNVMKKNPVDILTHPCIKTYPLDVVEVMALAEEYGCALEINNTNLRLGKTDVKKLISLVELAVEKGAALVENSDGHTYHEIGENEKIDEFLSEMGLEGDEVLMNRNDKKLDNWIRGRKELRSS